MVDKVDVTKIGARVTLLPAARDQTLVGKPGTIARAIKRSGEYMIRFDHGPVYYAFARNVSFLSLGDRCAEDAS